MDQDPTDAIGLAEALGVPIDAVKQAMKRLGIKGGLADDLFPQDIQRIQARLGRKTEVAPPRQTMRAAMQQPDRGWRRPGGDQAPFREAPGVPSAAQLTPSPGPAPTPATPRPAPAPPPPAAPPIEVEVMPPPPAAPAPTAPAPRTTDSFYKKQVEGLRTQVQTLREERDTSRKSLTTLEGRYARQTAKLQAKSAEPAVEAPNYASLREVLAATDVPAEALAGLLLRGVAQKLIGTLAVGDRRTLEQLLQRYVRRVCAAPTCQEQAQREGFEVIAVSGPECELCGDSDNTRAFNAMLATCRDAGVRRIAVLGGSPRSRQNLERLVQGTELTLELIDGDKNRKASRWARTMSDQDLLVIWQTTILKHSVSEPAEANAKKLNVPVIRAPGRSVASLATTVTEWINA